MAAVSQNAGCTRTANPARPKWMSYRVRGGSRTSTETSRRPWDSTPGGGRTLPGPLRVKLAYKIPRGAYPPKVGSSRIPRRRLGTCPTPMGPATASSAGRALHRLAGLSGSGVCGGRRRGQLDRRRPRRLAQALQQLLHAVVLGLRAAENQLVPEDAHPRGRGQLLAVLTLHRRVENQLHGL